ncbi:MAG: class II fructose-bisphosphate aldolase, partial [Nanoarchaeota archaeon]
ERTGCDFLAIAIGTSHGAYKFSGKAHLRMNILQEVKKKVKIPLVLHGASCVPLSAVREAQKYGANLKGVQGVPDAQIKQAVKKGICKFNTDTDLRIAFDAGVRKNIVNKPADFDPRHILAPAKEYMQKVVKHRIKLFGSGGKG